MKINDVVYGEEEINESVLVDLIISKSVQRLKGISQFGMPDEYYYKKGFSRYEHSLGVMILLRRLNASLEEQIAGLLHDVSHTAFSHVVDWVIGDPTKQDYQDKNHINFISNSEIPKILEKYGFNYESVSGIENFSLLEKEAPSLCADRVDYTLRELVIEGKKELVKKIFSDLSQIYGQIIFKNKEFAKIFGLEYVRCQNEHWAGSEARARYYILSKILRKAIKIKILSLSDLEKTDDYVISLLMECKDEEILSQLKLLRNGFKIQNCEDKGIVLKKKFRYVNPEILIDGKITFLSNVSQEYKSILEKEKQESVLNKRILILNK